MISREDQLMVSMAFEHVGPAELTISQKDGSKV